MKSEPQGKLATDDDESDGDEDEGDGGNEVSFAAVLNHVSSLDHECSIDYSCSFFQGHGEEVFVDDETSDSLKLDTIRTRWLLFLSFFV